MMVPLYLIRQSIEMAIAGYQKKNKLTPVPGSLATQKASWLPAFDKMFAEDDREELKRLALLIGNSGDPSATTSTNINRSFASTVPIGELRDAYADIRSMPDPKAAVLVGAVLTQMSTSAQEIRKKGNKIVRNTTDDDD